MGGDLSTSATVTVASPAMAPDETETPAPWALLVGAVTVT
jgi:hypothetical protein